MQTTTATTNFIDCSEQTAREAASRRAAEKARPFILFTKMHGQWIIEDRYATMKQLEAAVAYEIKWAEENDDFTPEAGVDYLAVQAHDI